jgi:hypothetical protein
MSRCIRRVLLSACFIADGSTAAEVSDTTKAQSGRYSRVHKKMRMRKHDGDNNAGLATAVRSWYIIAVRIRRRLAGLCRKAGKRAKRVLQKNAALQPVYALREL